MRQTDTRTGIDGIHHQGIDHRVCVAHACPALREQDAHGHGDEGVSHDAAAEGGVEQILSSKVSRKQDQWTVNQRTEISLKAAKVPTIKL